MDSDDAATLSGEGGVPSPAHLQDFAQAISPTTLGPSFGEAVPQNNTIPALASHDALIGPDIGADASHNSQPLGPEATVIYATGPLIGYQFPFSYGPPAMEDFDVNVEMVDDEGSLLGDIERNLDFVHFIEQWYYRSGTMNGELHSLSEDAIAIRRWTRPTEVLRSELNGDKMDCQGIDWTSLGVKRAVGRQVRRKLYTNYTNLPTYQQPGDCATQLPHKPGPYHFRRLNTRNAPHMVHFQLRNLISVSSFADIYYAGQSKIIRTDSFPRSPKQVVMDLTKPNIPCRYADPIRISTMTTAHDVLIAGGFQGEYAMTNLQSSVEDGQIEGLVTPDENGITNHVHIHLSRSSSLPSAVFCSNDQQIRVLDCATNKFVGAHKFDMAVNCAATSPDARLRVVVGDTKDVTIIEAASGRHLESLSGHRDYGFACAWADDGFQVATGNQDKQVRIYDARSWRRPLKVIAAEMGGVRSLRFSPVGGGRRSLLMAEPADLVSVVDTTTFESKQQLDHFGDTAGVDFTPDGSGIYVGIADFKFGGMMEYERIGRGVRSRKATPARADDPLEHGVDCCRYDDEDDNQHDERDDWLHEDALDFDPRVKRNAAHRNQRRFTSEYIVY
ncbi:MAG: hypothetical protein M1825_002410 [Sarcosagium campestre]|nr:MAG: hypothetical protein M1825_002410 [Sarcosagium campestre]